MIWALIAYALFVVATLLWGGLIGLRFKGTLKAEHPPKVLPEVSTVVPARNEERNIGRCASGLVRQDYPHLEMVFVDDDSRDATPDILAGFARGDERIKVVQTGGKPEGWNGKQWACHCGAMAASGEWLCFMDADTYAEPQLLSRTLAFALANDVDMLTLQPWYEMRGLWERIVLPVSLAPLLMLYPPERVNDPDDELAIANGQFILMRREVYRAIDGHAGVRDRMMDDFPLAENVKGAGYRLCMVDGTDVMRVRLYTNLREIRAGAIKAAVDITGGWRSTILLLIGYFLLNVLPSLLFFGALLSGRPQAALVLGATVLFQASYYALMRMLAFRVPPWSCVTYALGSLIVSIILIDGMIRVAIGREIRWKDRPVMGQQELVERMSVPEDN
jgi:chlorobactene glucosyltransferase